MASLLDKIKQLFAPKPIFGQDNGEGRNYVVKTAATNPTIKVYNPSPTETARVIGGGGGAGSGGGAGGSDTIIQKTGLTNLDIGGGTGEVKVDPVNNDGSVKSEAQIAQERYEAAKNAVISRLNMMKEEASRLRGEAQKGYDFTTGEVTKNYDALKKLSGEKLQQSLDTLTGQDTQVQNMYGRVSGNARRAMESALTRNRMLSRAMGNLGSSFYQNSQGDTTNQGMNTLNDTAIEEADKRGAIGTQRSATTTEFGQNEVAIDAEGTSLKNAALQKRDDEVAQANLLEKNYNIDSEQAISEANANLDSALNQIRTYTLANKPAASTGTTYSNLSANLPKYDAIAPIKTTLDNNQNYSSATDFITNAAKIGTGGTMYNPMSSSTDNSFLSKIKNNTIPRYDKDGRLLNPQY